MMLLDVPAPATLDPATDDATVVEKLTDLARDEREARADFIVYLAAFDQRRLYLKAGCSSCFAWLTERLRIPNASAFRRITAARLYTRMPAVAAYLREGRLSLTKLCFLKDVLEPDNCLALLEQAAAMAEKDVEELAVILDPRRKAPPPRDSIRPIPPAPRPTPTQADLFAALPPTPPPTTPTATTVTEQSRPAPERAAPSHLVKMTVGPDFMSLLEEVRAELSHGHPRASLEVVFAECMKTALATWRKRSRAATHRPRAASERPGKDPRDIPAHVRRAVWKRDGGRCTFVSDDGHRCSATHRLQLHHDHAAALGGPPTIDNLRIMCRSHNDLMARVDFGDEHMNRFTRRRSA